MKVPAYAQRLGVQRLWDGVHSDTRAAEEFLREGDWAQAEQAWKLAVRFARYARALERQSAVA